MRGWFQCVCAKREECSDLTNALLLSGAGIRTRRSPAMTFFSCHFLIEPTGELFKAQNPAYPWAERGNSVIAT